MTGDPISRLRELEQESKSKPGYVASRRAEAKLANILGNSAKEIIELLEAVQPLVTPGHYRGPRASHMLKSAYDSLIAKLADG